MSNNICKITKDNITSEPYFNVVMLCKLTGYADPIGAMKQLKTEWTVIKDRCGNIVSMAS